MTLLDLPTNRRAREPPLIAALLAEQQTLTAVDRFARLHDAGHSGPAHDRHYRDLIPLAAPAPGEQYAFSVDLDACSGCKACVTACHSLNGLDDHETFRDVGGLIGRDRDGLHVLQHVTTACHHCLEPACLTGCPTLAYDKDPVTGIVRHLDDQCIGCQYCTLMCPYDVPKYNAAKGIVRKCDMCRQRLADCEAPACVQACPNHAIRIELVRTDNVRQRSLNNEFLPHAPDPCLTQPTTRFVTCRRPLRDIHPVDSHDRPRDAHLPLVFMLVLTQMSIGMFIVAEALLVAGTASVSIVIAAAVVGVTGLASAVLHLGRPQIAYRAWLGWRTSWMSREIIALHVWLSAAALSVAATLLSNDEQVALARQVFGAVTAATGLVAMLCSAMIYVATRRQCWSASHTISRFAFTAALLGSAGALAIDAVTSGASSPALTGVVIAVAFVRLIADTTLYERRFDRQATERSRATDLLVGPLRHWNCAQALAAIMGGVVLPLTILEVPQFSAALATIAVVLLVAAELVQRGLFFAAAVGPQMPGVPHGETY
jgi:formate dehydrogenase iron-sulfur subunit